MQTQNYYGSSPRRTPAQNTGKVRYGSGASDGATGTRVAPAPVEMPYGVIHDSPGDGGGDGFEGPRGGGGSGGPRGGVEGGGGGGGGVFSGSGLGGGVGGNGGAADPATYSTPSGGLVGYYGNMMSSTGLTSTEQNALGQQTLLPIQQQAQQAEESMLRVRAATGNDAGIYSGLSQVSRDASGAIADQGRKNVLKNAEIARADQAAGAAGNLNLYGQTQAETMEYLRMLGNLLGRPVGTRTHGSNSGSTAGIEWNPGGAQGGM